MNALPRAALTMARGIVDHAIEVETEVVVLGKDLDWGDAEIGGVESDALSTLLQVKYALERALRALS